MPEQPVRKLSLSLRKKLQKSKEILKDRKFMKKLADDTADQIRKRTRLGKGVSKNGSFVKLKELSPSYIEYRKGKVQFWTNESGSISAVSALTNKELKSFRASKAARKANKNIRAFLKENKPRLSKFTRPSKSNLTATGQMLEGIQGRYRPGKLIFEIKGKRNKELPRSKNKLSNSQIARKVEDNGRRFFDLANNEVREIERVLRKRIGEILDSK